jgi:hypothetical protein
MKLGLSYEDRIRTVLFEAGTLRMEAHKPASAASTPSTS